VVSSGYYKVSREERESDDGKRGSQGGRKGNGRGGLMAIQHCSRGRLGGLGKQDVAGNLQGASTQELSVPVKKTKPLCT
jgi:hypothetical protein